MLGFCQSSSVLLSSSTLLHLPWVKEFGVDPLWVNTHLATSDLLMRNDGMLRKLTVWNGIMFILPEIAKDVPYQQNSVPGVNI